MKTKIEIKSVFGKLLFEFECENNTIKKTVEEAVESGADLSGARLSGANLYNANLYNANLYNAKNKEFAFMPIFCKWQTSIIGDKIKIGCKRKTIAEWDLWFESNEEFDTERGTEDFKQIQAVYKSYKAYINFLNK